MLSLFICEDNPTHKTHIQRVVENYVMAENLAMQVVLATHTPDEVLAYLSTHRGIAGLYFLDLDLGTAMDGIALAEAIRRYDPRGFIVFITADANSHSLTFEYKVEAMDYIVKGAPNMDQRICECLRNATAKLTARATPLQDNIVIKLSQDVRGWRGLFSLAKDSLVSVDSAKILCFITNPDMKHTVVMYTTDSRMEFRGNLTKIEPTLDKSRFFRCQRNMIVNLEKVISVDPVQLKLVLEHDLVVDIAAKSLKKLNEMLLTSQKI